MNYPTHSELVELWLETYFKNISCAVFFETSPGDNRIREITMVCGLNSRDNSLRIFTSDIYIFPIEESKLNEFVNNLDQNIYGYVMAWNGSEFVTHN